MESILTSIKKLLGMTAEYDHFDTDVIMYINSAFMTLNQLGVGPSKCFSIKSDAETWKNFLGDSENLEAVKTYVYLRVKLVFDPPPTAALLDSTNKQIAEYEWRLNVQSEEE